MANISLRAKLISITPADLVSQLLTLTQAGQVGLQDCEQAIDVRRRVPADVRRDNHVLCLPQRVTVRQWLGVCDVQSSATDQPFVQRIDQVIRVNDRPPRDIGDERPLGLQDLELGRREEMVRLVCQRHGDDEEIESRGQELVDLLFGLTREPL